MMFEKKKKITLRINIVSLYLTFNICKLLLNDVKFFKEILDKCFII